MGKNAQRRRACRDAKQTRPTPPPPSTRRIGITMPELIARAAEGIDAGMTPELMDKAIRRLIVDGYISGDAARVAIQEHGPTAAQGLTVSKLWPFEIRQAAKRWVVAHMEKP